MAPYGSGPTKRCLRLVRFRRPVGVPDALELQHCDPVSRQHVSQVSLIQQLDTVQRRVFARLLTEELIGETHFRELCPGMPAAIKGGAGHDFLHRIPAQLHAIPTRRLRLDQLALTLPEGNDIHTVVVASRRLVTLIPLLRPEYVDKTLEELPVH